MVCDRPTNVPAVIELHQYRMGQSRRSTEGGEECAKISVVALFQKIYGEEAENATIMTLEGNDNFLGRQEILAWRKLPRAVHTMKKRPPPCPP